MTTDADLFFDQSFEKRRRNLFAFCIITVFVQLDVIDLSMVSILGIKVNLNKNVPKFFWIATYIYLGLRFYQGFLTMKVSEFRDKLLALNWGVMADLASEKTKVKTANAVRLEGSELMIFKVSNVTNSGRKEIGDVINGFLIKVNFSTQWRNSDGSTSSNGGNEEDILITDEEMNGRSKLNYIKSAI